MNRRDALCTSLASLGAMVLAACGRKGTFSPQQVPGTVNAPLPTAAAPRKDGKLTLVWFAEFG